MTWLSRLSFGQALRWALLWPATLMAALAVTWLVAMPHGGAVSVSVEPAVPLPPWLVLTLVTSVTLLGPLVAFLAIWRLTRH